MVTQRVRIPCPNCSHGLHIRVKDMGRKGECKYCGHVFRPQEKRSTDPMPRMAGPLDAKSDHGQWVDTLERRLENTWARLSARQVSAIEQLMVTLGTPPAQPGAAAKTRAEAPARRDPERSHGTHRLSADWENGVEPPDEDLVADFEDNDNDDDRLELSFEDGSVTGGPARASDGKGVRGVTEGRLGIAGAGTETFEFQGEVPSVSGGLAIPPADVVKCVNRLVRERDEARAQCVQLAHEVERVRDELAERGDEVARLRKSADRLKAVRAERDRLNAERTMLTREATQLQSRMLETQVALVEVGAELDECRERLLAERREWQQQRQELIEQAEHQLSTLRSQTTVAGRDAECRTAELDTLGDTLADADFHECATLSDG